MHVIGPIGDPKKAAIAAKHLADGATVVAWDVDGAALENAIAGLPRTPPGRLATWVGSSEDPALKAFIEEILDPTVK